MAADHRAHAAVRSAIVTGVLAPLSGQRCADCGQQADSYHHHRGYARKDWLVVVALCGACHRLRHRLPQPLMVSVTVRLPEDVHAELVEVAREQRRSLNTALVVAAERYIRQTRARQPKDAQDGR